MASSVNKVILIGNLGKDPDVRRFNSGDQVVSFSIATSETWRDKSSGERKERTEWHNVVIFNENLGKVAEQYCKKGSKVYLEGQLQTRKWQDQSGADRWRFNSGDQVVSFSIATSETWRDKSSGERKERTEWHNVVIFNENLGKVAEQYCKKGSKVYLEGQLQTRKWQDQSGADRYMTEVVLQRFRGELQLLDSRGGGEGRDSFSEEGASRGSGFNRAAISERRPAFSGGASEIDDDIPF